jgi:membrane protein DedA with SNARE-associated domain
VIHYSFTYPRKTGDVRKALLAAAAVRGVLEVAAIPLAPFLYKKHIAVLLLLRPTKDTLLFAGFAAHRHRVSLPVVAVAAMPLLIAGVWQFFALGRAYSSDLAKHELPGIAGRVLPRKRVRKMQAAIDREGDKVVFLGRLAAMPSTLVAAAAGAADLDWRRFLIVDAAGAVTSLVLMVGLGWFLENAYDAAGPWLTALGVGAIAAVAIVVGRAVSREEARPRAKRAASSRR